MSPPCGTPILWGISPDFSGLSPCYRWIAYVLLTRAPVAGKGIATSPLPLDLHVLGLSLAFILSQDQTLRCIFFILYYTFEASPDRIDVVLSFSCTTLASSILSMNFFYLKRLPCGPSVLRKCCKDTAFILYTPNIFQCFLKLFFK